MHIKEIINLYNIIIVVSIFEAVERSYIYNIFGHNIIISSHENFITATPVHFDTNLESSMSYLVFAFSNPVWTLHGHNAIVVWFLILYKYYNYNKNISEYAWK